MRFSFSVYHGSTQIRQLCDSAKYHTSEIVHLCCCSLDNNPLLCTDKHYNFTAEGITTLCAGLKESKIMSLR